MSQSALSDEADVQGIDPVARNVQLWDLLFELSGHAQSTFFVTTQLHGRKQIHSCRRATGSMLPSARPERAALAHAASRNQRQPLLPTSRKLR